MNGISQSVGQTEQSLHAISTNLKNNAYKDLSAAQKDAAQLIKWVSSFQSDGRVEFHRPLEHAKRKSLRLLDRSFKIKNNIEQQTQEFLQDLQVYLKQLLYHVQNILSAPAGKSRSKSPLSSNSNVPQQDRAELIAGSSGK